MSRLINLTNRKIEMVTVLRRNGHIGKESAWLCECECGKQWTTTGKRIRQNQVKSCGCQQRNKRDKNKEWKGHKEISGSFWGRCVRSAKKRNIEFNLEIEDAWEQWIHQNGLCKFTKIPLKLAPTSIGKDNKIGTASLDRIDSSKGYIQGNIQWVHKRINMMKSNMSDEEFKKWCKLVTNNGL